MKTIFAMTITCLTASISLVASPNCDWTSVNHDLHNTRSSPCTTITFQDLKSGLVQLQWSATGAAVQVAPVVSNNVVYYGDGAGNFFAYDTATGAQLHAHTFPSGETINGPAAVVGSTIYVTTVSANSLPAGGLRLYALDLTLTPIPGFNGGSPVDVHPGFTGEQGNILAGPVVVDNLVIVATSNATSEETLSLTPTYRGGFHTFNATDGSFVWRTIVSPASSGFGTSGGSWSTAAIDRKRQLMFAGTTNATTPPASNLTDALLAIDYTTGVIKWSQQYTADDVYSFQYACGKDLDNGASPNLFTIHNSDKKIDVVGAGSKAGVYRVFERGSGKPVWSKQMIRKNTVPSIDGNPSAAFANDTVYTIAIRDKSGVSYNALSVMAQYGLSAGNTVAIGQLVFYIGHTDITYIRALDAKTGDIRWTNKNVSASLGAITEANGVLYTGNFNGDLRAINAENGHEHLIANLGGATIGAPVTVVNNQIFVGFGLGGPGGLSVYHKP